MGALQLGIGATTTAIVSLLSNHSELPMTGIMFICAFTSLLILLTGRRIIRNKQYYLPAERKQEKDNLYHI